MGPAWCGCRPGYGKSGVFLCSRHRIHLSPSVLNMCPFHKTWLSHPWQSLSWRMFSHFLDSLVAWQGWTPLCPPPPSTCLPVCWLVALEGMGVCYPATCLRDPLLGAGHRAECRSCWFHAGVRLWAGGPWRTLRGTLGQAGMSSQKRPGDKDRSGSWTARRAPAVCWHQGPLAPSPPATPPEASVSPCPLLQGRDRMCPTLRAAEGSRHSKTGTSVCCLVKRLWPWLCLLFFVLL